MNAFKFRATVPADHFVKVPEEIPEGPVEITVVVDMEPAGDGMADRRRAAMGALAARFVVPDDFNEPLPPEIQRYFDGESDPEDHLS